MARIYVKDEEDDGGEEMFDDINNDESEIKPQKRKFHTHARYIDSLSFLKSSLANLAESIPHDSFKCTNAFVKKYFIKKPYPNSHVYSKPPDTVEETELHYTSLRRERYQGYTWVEGKYNLRYKDMDDYRNWIPAAIPTYIPDHVKQQINGGVALLRKKGIKPYDWMDDEEEMNETQLPPMDEFYHCRW